MNTWLIIGLVAAIFLFNWYNAEKKKGAIETPLDVLKHPRVKLFAAIIGMIGLTIGAVNLLVKPYEPTDPHDQISYGTRFDKADLAIQGYDSLLVLYPDSAALHVEYIEYASNNSPAAQRQLAGIYSGKTYSRNPNQLFIGQLGKGLTHALEGDMVNAQNALGSIPSPDRKYVNYAFGILQQGIGQDEVAIQHFEHEIEQNGYLKGAYQRLASHYFWSRQDDKLYELVTRPGAEDYVSSAARKEIHFKKRDVGGYVSAMVDQVSSQLNLPGIIAALLVMLAWLLYVRRLDVFEPEPWRPIITVLILGMLFTFLVFPISDSYTYIFGFEQGTNSAYNFLYCWWGIGVPEELVKILPVLLLLRFTNRIDEPYDYILYASVAALGFAFSENLLYYQETSLTNISARALSAVVAHMFFTSIIAYGMLLNKYKLKKNKYLVFILFFALASIAHGFYDFWLIDDWAKQFSAFTIFFFLGSVHLWVLFKNNALNNSTYYSPDVQINNSKLSAFLIVALVGVVMMEFILVAVSSSPEVANANLGSSMLFTGFLIFYLTTNFSRFKIQRGKWAQLRIRIPFVGVKSFARDDKVDHSGLEVTLYNAKENPTQIIGLPAKGILLQRITVSDDDQWYMVQLDLRLGYPQYVADFVLIRAKNKDKRLNDSNPCPVSILLIPPQTQLSQENLDINQLHPMGVVLSVKRE